LSSYTAIQAVAEVTDKIQQEALWGRKVGEGNGFFRACISLVPVMNLWVG